MKEPKTTGKDTYNYDSSISPYALRAWSLAKK